MGLFDQDDVPIINSILGGGGNNLPSTLGLNNYGAGDRYANLNPYSTGAQPIPTDISGASAQPIPNATGMPDATMAVAPVTAPQASGQVPMPTSAFGPTPQASPNASIIGQSGLVPGSPTPQASPAVRIGMRPGSPAPAMSAPINVGAGPGVGYPTQPPMPRPVGAPAAPGAQAGGIDVGSKANWLGRALGATSPAQGQSIAQQFLSGLGAGMSAAAHYANKPGGAAFAGSFGAAMQGAQARGDTQQAMAFKAWQLQNQQKQQDFMNRILTGKMNLAEKAEAHKERNDEINADTNRVRVAGQTFANTAHGQYWLDMRQRENGRMAFGNTPEGREHQIQSDANQRFGRVESQIQNNYRAELQNITPDIAAANRNEALKKLETDRNAFIDEQRKLRGVDPSKLKQGTPESPYTPNTSAEILGYPVGKVYEDPNKKGHLIVRGQDQYNSPNPPAPPPPQAAPETPQQAVPQTEAGNSIDLAPSDQELSSIAAQET